MDLRLYSRVLWRFRVIVLIGFLFALGLTVLTVARVSFKSGRPSIAYRQHEIWQSTSTLFITQSGAPLVSSANADPNRFSSYATLYASLATSDQVQQLMRRKGPVPGAVTAQPAVMQGLGTPLPFLNISGLARTPADAIVAAKRGTQALIAYIQEQQSALGLPAGQRVVLQVLNKPRGAAKIGTRSKTRPVVVFLAAMMAVLGLVFVLENLRPRLRTVEREEGLHGPVDATRRSA